MIPLLPEWSPTDEEAMTESLSPFFRTNLDAAPEMAARFPVPFPGSAWWEAA